MAKVRHDRPNCIGCGACAATCPKFWEMGEDGKSHLKGSIQVGDQYELNDVNDPQDVDCNKQAEAGCPVNVIHVE